MSALLGPDGEPARPALPFGFQAETERSFAAPRPRRRAYFHWGEQPNVDAEAQAEVPQVPPAEHWA